MRHRLQHSWKTASSTWASWCRASRCLVALFFALGVFVLGSFAARWQFLYGQEIASGTAFWEQDFSGMNRAEAREELEGMITEWEQETVEIEVSLTEHQQLSEFVTVDSLGIYYDADALVEQMFVSRGAEAQLLDGLHGAAPEVQVAVGDDVVGRFMEQVLDHAREPRNAHILLDEETGRWVLQEEVKGFRMSDEQETQVKAQLEALANREAPEEKVQVDFETILPEVQSSDLRQGFDALQAYLQKTVYIVQGQERELLSLVSAPWMLQYRDGEVSLSRDALAEYVADWAERFDSEPGEVVYGESYRHEKGHLMTPYEGDFTPGKRLAQQAMVEALIDAFGSEEASPDVELIVEMVSPRVLDAEGRELSLLSRGRSSYRLGNGADRVYNVKHGLSLYDGVRIPQGEEFNFNQVLGWVTYDAGWKPALAIFGGGGVRKVPGGGLCQVSTTMYRAGVLSGLPITQRKPHSLDISYYHAYGEGIDATVYPPEDINLKFLNDTPGDIYMHTYVDDVLEEAFVEFYGVDDGREVELVKTVDRKVKLPHEVSYTDEIDQGLQEVLNKGRQGRYVEYEWLVKKGEEVEKRTIETLYPAAARKVRVGTGG